MREAVAAVLAIGLTACSDIPLPVAPNATLTPPSATFGRSGFSAPIPGRYIVRFRNDERDVQGHALRLAGQFSGKVHYIYKSAMKGMAIELPDALATTLHTQPGVLSVEQDQTMSVSTEQTPVTWGLDRIDQYALPLNNSYNYYATGAGVNAYIIDTGILFEHTEFGGRAATGLDVITPGGTATDCHGHGTHVAGTVGGTTYGVAKSVNLVAVRVLNCSGSGSTSGVIAGVDWVTANHVKPAVANMSLGGGASLMLDNAVEASIAAGVTYAIAAGNGIGGIAQNACNSSPARVGSAITVSATDNLDTKATWANYGTCVKIFAPGVSITSAWKTNPTATNTISGTSMATPHVAGTAALYLERNPAATPAAVLGALTANATPGVVLLGGLDSPNLLLYEAFIGSGVPVAQFVESCSELTCIFDTSTTIAQPSATYSWDFGDATTGTGVSPTHTYPAEGVYFATLTVTDAGGSNALTRTVEVLDPPPVASFAAFPEGLLCFFNAGGSTGRGLTYAWNFGDTTTETGIYATHTYAAVGDYVATLTVTDVRGRTSTTTLATAIR